MDRVEVALDMLADRSRARTSQMLGELEHAVSARLSSGLWVLLSPCRCLTAPGAA